jgi:hypothetical protein
MKRIILLTALGCAAGETQQQPVATAPATPPPATAPVADANLGSIAASAANSVPTVAPTSGEVWLKGSTHVHAKPSGDSSEPIDRVLSWYESHSYDFIVLSDHNKISVTEVAGQLSTAGQVAVRVPDKGLIVIAGVELTHNRNGCLPAGDDSGKCRIHVNALGVTERPEGKIDWPVGPSKQRVDLYQAALTAAGKLGGAIIQINHPNYYFGTTPDLIIELAKRGARLVEIANSQFTKWNAGDATWLSTEALWDAALVKGAKIWGVASDDAHDYPGPEGKYPPGGGWVVVRAKREPRAILDALAAGRFYASTGVELSHAEVDGEELVVEITPAGARQHTITFIENGTTVATVRELSAKRSLPRTGYVRAVITRDDGKKAWVQPARR